MSIVERAFHDLWPEKEFRYLWTIKYSKAFSGFNANVKYTKTSFHFRLADDWKDVSEEIKIGLIQSLLLKIFKEKKRSTTYIDLYNLFLKNVHIGVPKENIDPILFKSFCRVNEKYFAGMVETPNLAWGKENFSRLGTYEYGSDTITLSGVLEKNQELLDYVMYHEMLHKKLKFFSKGARNLHHSKEFRKKEKEWEDKDAEKKLADFLRKEKRGLYFRTQTRKKPFLRKRWFRLW